MALEKGIGGSGGGYDSSDISLTSGDWTWIFNISQGAELAPYSENTELSVVTAMALIVMLALLAAKLWIRVDGFTVLTAAIPLQTLYVSSGIIQNTSKMLMYAIFTEPLVYQRLITLFTNEAHVCNISTPSSLSSGLSFIQCLTYL
jgi:hypothetical protein